MPLAQPVRGHRVTDCYQAFDAPLRAFLARQTQSSHDAEDLTQEVFLRLLRLGATTEIRCLKSFLFTTAINLVKDRSRRTYTRWQRNSVPASEAELLDFAAEPSGAVECDQTLGLLQQALARLPDSTRQAFLLSRLEAHPQAEIAARMGISVSMVEKHMRSAVQALREVISHG